MTEQNKIILFIKRIFSRFVKKDVEAKKRRSDEAKREMCRRATQTNVCPGCCEICAWNVRG